ncbi:MAG TPA: beta-ketoacyl-ACP synthase III [Acidimicrobiales bacterium]|jgi:3-oxoacyl-[acyl-carrier-protein] synthase-3|nr:beta-ketoacyl-ACP synthase III [Acidimicrobiales bacterium]
MRSARITGWGTALPDKVVTNADLEAMLDTSDEWIVERSGIRERRVGGTTATLAVASGTAAMEKAGVKPSEIDLLILCTTTPDQQVPATSAVVQHELGLACGAFDVNAACSGFVYGLVTAHQFVAGGSIEQVLLIGSETLSRITDWDDRSTAVLFADGAGAVVLSAADDSGEGTHLLGWDLGCDGSARSILDADIGGFIHMEGREVFRRAVRVMIDSGKRAMDRAGVNADDIALVVPHQANLRIIESANAKLGLPMDRTAVVLDYTGNTSSASIPLALVDAIDQGRLSPGDLIMFVGFGAGMTWASAILRWDPS